MKAIIDLGTNTFHLLIAEMKNGELFESFKMQFPVKLGKDGINKGIISEAAFQRGLLALGQFRTYLDQFHVQHVKAFATSAIRSASNGAEFIAEALRQHQISIQAISGDEEAAYIYKGVSKSFALPEEEILVMDIGGGSVEFIIGRQEKIHWKQSFDLGAARLIEKFHRQEPIVEDELHALNLHLAEKLKPLFKVLEKFPCRILAGSAGSFETLVDIVMKDLHVIPNRLSRHAFEIRLSDFEVFYELMITSNREQRENLQGMTDFRVEMIVAAAVLKKFVIEHAGICKLICSDYSLKEGVIFALSA